MSLSIINLIAVLALAFMGSRAIRRITSKKSSSVDIVILAHIVLCGIPLLLDELIGLPNYTNAPGFVSASEDYATCVVYCIYAVWAAYLWQKCGRIRFPSVAHNGKDDGMLRHAGMLWHIPPYAKMLLFAVMLLPLMYVMTLPDRKLYWVFSSTLRYDLSDSYMAGHYWVNRLCYLSLLAGSWLLLDSRPWKQGRWPSILSCMMIMPVLVCTIWIHGKRNSVAVMGILFLFVFYYRGLLTGRRAFGIIMAMLVGVLGFSFFFQAYTGRVTTSWYENARIDYGRDDVIKLTLFAELHPNELQILEYRGQSYLYYLLCWIPRDVWADKPLPYAHYMTSAMRLSPPKMWLGSMTTSWLEEAVANLGWWGVLWGPLSIALFCRIGDMCRNGVMRLLTPLLGCLLLTTHLVAVFPLYVIWFVFALFERPWRRRVNGCESPSKNVPVLAARTTQ